MHSSLSSQPDTAHRGFGHALVGWLGACVPGSSALTQAATRPATSAALAVLVSNDGVMRARSHAANR